MILKHLVSITVRLILVKAPETRTQKDIERLTKFVKNLQVFKKDDCFTDEDFGEIAKKL